MRQLANLLALTAVLAVATVLIGWSAVPVVAAVWVYSMPRRGAVIYAAVAGALAWGGLLLWYARSAPIGAADALVTEILGVPARSLIVLTLAYAALLSGSAALVAQWIRARR